MARDPRFIWELFIITSLAFVAVACSFVAYKFYNRLRRKKPIDLNQPVDRIVHQLLLWSGTVKGKTHHPRREAPIWIPPLLSYIWHYSPGTRRILKLQIVTLALVSLLEFVANDRPLFVQYKGLPHFPVFRIYSEQKFGGDFETAIDYKDPDAMHFIELSGWVIWTPIRWSYHTYDITQCYLHPAPPTWLYKPSLETCQTVVKERSLFGNQHWLGTDEAARDVLSFALYGIRLYAYLAALIVVVATLAGVASSFARFMLGIRRRSSAIILTIARSIPVLLTMIVLFLDRTLSAATFVLVLSIYFSTNVSHRINREVASSTNSGLLLAALALGSQRLAVWRRHLWPIAAEAAIIVAPEVAMQCLGLMLALDFFGYGFPPGWPTIGGLFASAKQNVQAPWLGITGFIAALFLLAPLSVLRHTVEVARAQMLSMTSRDGTLG